MFTDLKEIHGQVRIQGKIYDFVWRDGNCLNISGLSLLDFLDVVAALDDGKEGGFEVGIPRKGNGTRKVESLRISGQDPPATADSQQRLNPELHPEPAVALPSPSPPSPPPSPLPESSPEVLQPQTGSEARAGAGVDVLALCRAQTFGQIVAEFVRAGITKYPDILAAAEPYYSQVPLLGTNVDWRDRLQLAAVNAKVEGSL